MGLSFTGAIHEIDADIFQSQLRLSALPRHHPHRPFRAFFLASQLLERYELSNQRDDIDKAILYLTDSLLSPPLSWLARGPVILDVLFCLADLLSGRSRVVKEAEDIIYAAKYLRYLRDTEHTLFAFERHQVTAQLVETLALQTGLKASDIVQTFEEMTALTQELLTSDPSSDHTTRATVCFTRAVKHKLPELSTDRLSNKIIECLRLARMHKPELREVLFLLRKFIFPRYYNTLDDELVAEDMSILDEIIASSSPGDIVVPECQKMVALLAMLRARNPETSEEAIYRARAFLASSSVEDPLYIIWSYVLEYAAKNRFTDFGPIDGHEASSSSAPLGSLLTSWPVPADVADIPGPLCGLLDQICNNDIPDIEEAIELGRSILASCDPSDLYSSHDFCEILFEAFERTKNINYLNESIHTLHQLIARRSLAPNHLHMHMIHGLLKALNVRSFISRDYHIQAWEELLELIPLCLDCERPFTSLPRQFHSACVWAYFVHINQHPPAFTAYEIALSLMQDIASFSPTLQLQHATLLTLPSHSHEMPLAYASYLVEQGQLEQAVETLERGRALLWSEMRHLRTSVDQLLDADPELGHKFAALNGDLDELTKSIPPSHKLNRDDIVADDLRAGDQFGSFLRRQRGLLKERDNLISQIRALPGFDRFLTYPLFDTLRSAASSGPVIIVNHTRFRSDILILLHNASPSLIPTPNDFYDRASALKDKLLTSRVTDGLDSKEYDQNLASVLAELYKLVGKPVIERLRQLQVSDQSRVWWCPTSVLCSLPLHAMGPIPSDDGELRYFLDLYICSYTPSLSALIRSRNHDSGYRFLDRPPILLVAQTDPSLPTVGGEIQVVQALDTEVTSLISAAATPGATTPAVDTLAEAASALTVPTPAAVLDGFQHHRFVHFACHGTLEANKPFEAGFELHRGERLTLLEIVRADLPTAEFAFLSACHTAEVTEGSITDEGLHLAAAVQYSGFRSVVGTMWAMADMDGRDLAENFYKALFSNSRRDQGTPFHERSAKALRSAVKKLRRRRRMTLERWVNFVHYGA